MKYSIHRLLALRKSTMERIKDEITNATFISTVQGKSRTINGVLVKEVESGILSSYQKINGLISNYQKIKSALLRSNAGITAETDVTRYEVAGNWYTMAELIDTFDNVYGNKRHTGFKEILINVMTQQYNVAVKKVETQKQRVEEQIRDYFAKAATNDKQLSTDDIAKRTQMFKEDGELRLVDPLGLQKEIEKIRNEINRFKDECDATMSEQNATTVVEVDLTD